MHEGLVHSGEGYELKHRLICAISLIKTINRLHRFHSSHPYGKHTAWHCSLKVGELRIAVRGMKQKPFNLLNQLIVSPTRLNGCFLKVREARLISLIC